MKRREFVQALALAPAISIPNQIERPKQGWPFEILSTDFRIYGGKPELYFYTHVLIKDQGGTLSFNGLSKNNPARALEDLYLLLGRYVLNGDYYMPTTDQEKADVVGQLGEPPRSLSKLKEVFATMPGWSKETEPHWRVEHRITYESMTDIQDVRCVLKTPTGIEALCVPPSLANKVYRCYVPIESKGRLEWRASSGPYILQVSENINHQELFAIPGVL